jgi:hemerythrin-like domain-containing protein
MASASQPNIGATLILIHRIITRGLEVAQAKSEEFGASGFPDGQTKTGFGGYVRSLATVLHGHHLTEDELAFPYLRAHQPQAPYDQLAFDHKAMTSILPQVEAAAGSFENGGRPSVALRDLNRAVSRLRDIWRPHIGLEEEHFSVSALAESIAADEHVRMLQKFGEFSQQHANPDYLVLPFMLHNLNRDDRAAFAAEFPPVVSRELVPVAWKEHWAPMAPFLLP